MEEMHGMKSIRSKTLPRTDMSEVVSPYGYKNSRAHNFTNSIGILLVGGPNEYFHCTEKK